MVYFVPNSNITVITYIEVPYKHTILFLDSCSILKCDFFSGGPPKSKAAKTELATYLAK